MNQHTVRWSLVRRCAATNMKQSVNPIARLWTVTRTIQAVTKDTFLQLYIRLLTAAAPSDRVFRALGTNWLTYWRVTLDTNHTYHNLSLIFTTVPFESLFTLDCNNKGTRGHLAKLSKPRCQKGVRKYLFSYRVINRWNVLDEEIVSSSSINVFKNRLNKIRLTRMGCFMDWLWLALDLPDALPWKATQGEIPRWDTKLKWD